MLGFLEKMGDWNSRVRSVGLAIEGRAWDLGFAGTLKRCQGQGEAFPENLLFLTKELAKREAT